MRQVSEAGAYGPVDVPGYVVSARLGSGGFGEVFQARHAVIDREVAIKVLHAKYSADTTAVARFVAEARAVNRISHPGIVEVYDFGQLADGRHYCVMELVSGRTLRELLREHHRLPLAEALPILRGIAEALDAAHGAGVAHRDLKPDNVFVPEGGGVKLIDFGLAKLTGEDVPPLTETGAIFGTPQYMSPEQCRGKAVGVATDAYSFGVVAYQILTGELPFSGDALELALHHLNDIPEPPSQRCPELSPSVDRAVLALLAKNPAQRPEALQGLVDEMLAPVRATRRTLLFTAGIGLLASVAVAVALLGSRSGHDRSYKAHTITIDSIDRPEQFSLSVDGTTIAFRDASGNLFRQRLGETVSEQVATPIPSCAGSVNQLPDGRLAITCMTPVHSLWVQSRTGWRKVTSADVADLSPDGRSALIARGQTISLFDLETGHETFLTEAKIWGARWSPDGRKLVWSRRNDGLTGDLSSAEWVLEVYSIADRSVTHVPVQNVNRATIFYPAAFVDPDRLVYCADHDGHQELRLHSLVTHHEQTLRELGSDLVDCAVAASRDGERIVVLVGHGAAASGILRVGEDTWHTSGSLRLPSGEWFAPVAVSEAGDQLWGFIADDRLRYGAVGQWSPTLSRRIAMRSTARNGGYDEVVGCPGTEAFVRLGSRMLLVSSTREAGDTRLLLRAPKSCTVVHEWRLAGTNWSLPQCGRNACAIARTRQGRLEIFELPLDGQPRDFAWPAVSAEGTAVIAVAEDGSRVAALVLDSHEVIFADRASGATTRYAFEGWVQHVRFGADHDHVLVAGFGFDGGEDMPAGHAHHQVMGIIELAIDGKRRFLWKSEDTQLRRMDVSGDGKTIAASLRTYSIEPLVFALQH